MSILAVFVIPPASLLQSLVVLLGHGFVNQLHKPHQLDALLMCPFSADFFPEMFLVEGLKFGDVFFGEMHDDLMSHSPRNSRVILMIKLSEFLTIAFLFFREKEDMFASLVIKTLITIDFCGKIKSTHVGSIGANNKQTTKKISSS